MLSLTPQCPVCTTEIPVEVGFSGYSQNPRHRRLEAFLYSIILLYIVVSSESSLPKDQSTSEVHFLR